jgi:hypothetical protein
MLSCPLCFHNDPNYGSFAVTQLDCDIYIAFNIATITIRGTYHNMSGQMTSGVLQVPTMSGEAVITSCDLYFNGRHYVSSVIDPTIVNVEKNASPSYTTEVPFNPSAFSMPFSDCPSNSAITADITYIQQLSFTANGSFQLNVPLQIPPANCSPSFQYYASIKCVLDSGTPSCQYQCLSHPMSVVQQHTPFSYPNNPYLLSGTAAVALQSSPIPFPQTREFVFQYLGYGAVGLTGTCLLESPAYTNIPGSSVSPSRFKSLTFHRRGTLFFISLQQLLNRTPSLEGTWCVFLSSSPSP